MINPANDANDTTSEPCRSGSRNCRGLFGSGFSIFHWLFGAAGLLDICRWKVTFRCYSGAVLKTRQESFGFGNQQD